MSNATAPAATCPRRVMHALTVTICALAAAAAILPATASAELLPAPTIDAGPAEGSVQRDLDIAYVWSHTDPRVTSYTCVLDGYSEPCIPAKIYYSISAGSHTFELTGNGTLTASVHFTIDRAPPDLWLTGGPAEGSTWYSSTVQFTLSLEAGATYMCSLDSALATPCSSPVTLAGIRSGLRAFTITGTDAVGNTGSNKRTFTAYVTRTVKRCRFVKVKRHGRVLRTKKGKARYKKVCRRVKVRV